MLHEPLDRYLCIYGCVCDTCNACCVQCLYYSAPLRLWTDMQRIIMNDMNIDVIHDDQWSGGKKVICIGQEWYRMPTTLLISRVARIGWLPSEFDGQLPAEFASYADGGTSVAFHPFNDKNQREESRFVNDVKSECDFIIDLWETNTVLNGYDLQSFEVIQEYKYKFLDRKETAGIYRSYYLPFISEQKVIYGQYVVLRRKHITK